MFVVYHCPLCQWRTRLYDLWEIEDVEVFTDLEITLIEHVEGHVTELEEDIESLLEGNGEDGDLS
jgi:hypothetical protein